MMKKFMAFFHIQEIIRQVITSKIESLQSDKILLFVPKYGHKTNNMIGNFNNYGEWFI